MSGFGNGLKRTGQGELKKKKTGSAIKKNRTGPSNCHTPGPLQSPALTCASRDPHKHPSPSHVHAYSLLASLLPQKSRSPEHWAWTSPFPRSPFPFSLYPIPLSSTTPPLLSLSTAFHANDASTTPHPFHPHHPRRHPSKGRDSWSVRYILKLADAIEADFFGKLGNFLWLV